MATLYRYPPSKDNPGKVSEGAARDMRNQAEAHHRGSQTFCIGKMVSMVEQADETTTQRNARKRQRRARRG